MIERLLVPLEEGALGNDAFDAGLRLAKQLRAAMIGLVVEPFVAPPPPSGPSLHAPAAIGEQALIEHAGAVLRPFEERARQLGVCFRGVVVQATDVARAIVDEAAEQGADMIVMATHGRGLLGEFFWGANTRKVMAATRLPVLVLRPPSGAPASIGAVVAERATPSAGLPAREPEPLGAPSR